MKKWDFVKKLCFVGVFIVALMWVSALGATTLAGYLEGRHGLRDHLAAPPTPEIPVEPDLEEEVLETPYDEQEYEDAYPEYESNYYTNE